MAVLEEELETYRKNLPTLLLQEGKHVVISGTEILDTFASYGDALRHGYRTVGFEKPILVKRITRIQPVGYFSRDLRFAKPRL